MGFVDEKSKRVKYIRALEKFSKSAICILKREDFDIVEFKDRMQKNSKSLDKVEPVYLDSPYTKAVEDFTNLVLSNEDREVLLKSANRLDKLKNSKNYKKDKHKNKFKDD